MSPRDKRALQLGGVGAAIVLVIWLWPAQDVAKPVVSADTVEMAEKRLARSRQLATQAPAREALLKKASDELAAREKGMIQADTAAQAQAELLQMMRRIGRAQAPPIEIRATEIGNAKPFGADYGEVFVSVSIECQADQLVNLLADLGSQKELIATSDIRIGTAGGREKVMPVRITVSGIVPRKLIPEKKGPIF